MPVQSRFPVDRFAGPRPAYLQSALFLLRDPEAVTQIDPRTLALPYFNVFCYTGRATLPKPTLGPTGSQSGAKVTSKVTPNDIQSEIGSLPFRKPCNLDF